MGREEEKAGVWIEGWGVLVASCGARQLLSQLGRYNDVCHYTQLKP